MFIPILLSTFLSFYLINFTHLPQTLKHLDFYTEGVRQRDSGNWQEAIKIWLTAKDTLQSQGASDPRISIAFIELVTRQKAKEYYPEASEIYFWGFSNSNLDKYQEEIQKELERIAPLLDQKEVAEWKKYLDNHDATLFSKIRSFWVQKDPVPTTVINERLLEHWQRIAYVREKFRMDSTNVYGSDDRGLIFVKYGEPNIIYQGKLGIDQFEIMRWIDNFLIRQEIQRYNTLPEFEIWIYATLNSDESTIFLFGKRDGMGRFGLRIGLEDFIPERAFSRSSGTNTRGILPGTILQIQYYRELINLDKFYLERYRELEAIWSNARASGLLSPNHHVLRGLLNHYRSIDRDRAQLKYLPLDQSDYEISLEPIDVLYKRVRVLYPDNKPMLFVLTASEPHSDIEEKTILFFKRRRKSKRYNLEHHFIIYDRDWNEIYRAIEVPLEKSTNTSLFLVPQLDENIHYIYVAERTSLSKPKSKPNGTMPDSPTIVGIGKAILEETTPLATDSNILEVSDLILGTKTSAGFDTAFFYPFPIVPKNRIRKTDSLRVYLEIYHLSMGPNHQANFTINYVIKQVKRKRKSIKYKKILTQSFDFYSPESALKKTLEIDTSKLKRGEYELELQVVDKVSSQKKNRTEIFQITE